jgi:hypothetical protein
MKNLISILCCGVMFTTACPANAVELFCELGQRLSITGNHRLDEIIDLQWRGRLYRMQRVSTSTGAHRFENAESGLIWIDIPAKSMLLDRKNAAQLANECKTAE